MAKNIVTARRLSGNKEAQLVATLSGSIAHEIKNYLAAISICAELSESKLSDIRKSVRAADYLINNLQLQIKGIITGEPDTKDFRCYSITQNIKEALEQYPFETKERELIIVESGKDFEYTGNSVLTSHILFNLIKNSLRAIKNAGRGKITIKLDPGLKLNKLIFRDTATGISKDFLPKMFKLFESQMVSHGGTGIGLAFCKIIMNAYKGDIICNSVDGEYTEFTLKFPCIV
jgi:Signal transduction histidine kinase